MLGRMVKANLLIDHDVLQTFDITKFTLKLSLWLLFVIFRKIETF